MAYLYSKELRPFLKDNCLLFGHSIGGLVAYEICKDLETQIHFKRMIISSVNPPHCVMDDVDLHAEMDTPTLIKKCAELGGIPMIFKEEPELLEMFIAGLRADLKALEKYSSAERKNTDKLKTSASVLYSDKDYIVDESKLQEWKYYLDCSEFVKFSGDHFYLFDEANRKAVGQILTKHVNL
jgi:surfactin synthase thioesterase subunit